MASTGRHLLRWFALTLFTVAAALTLHSKAALTTSPPSITISNVAPTFASTDGGTPITFEVHGSYASLTTSVSGASATLIAGPTSNRWTLVAPPHGAGPADVTVTADTGAIVTFTLTYLALPGGALAAPISRLSVAANGAEGVARSAVHAGSYRASAAANGRYVAFLSDTDLGLGAPSSGSVLYRKDSLTGELVALATCPAGCSSISISDDGSTITFNREVSPGVQGVFVRTSPFAAAAARADVDGSGGASAGAGPSALSGSGRFVAFTSASNLDADPADADGTVDLFVRDLETATTERWTTGKSIDAPALSISSDGRFVVFTSKNALVAGEDLLNRDVYLLDRQAPPASALEALTPSGTSGEAIGGALVSRDGSTVAFTSPAADLVAGDTNGAADVFVIDVSSRTITRVGAAPSGDAQLRALSGDGQHVAFTPAADPGAPMALLVADRQSSTTQVVNASADGVVGDAATVGDVSFAAGRVVFSSIASNLVPGDTNALSDVFEKHLSPTDDEDSRTISLSPRRVGLATGTSTSMTVLVDGTSASDLVVSLSVADANVASVPTSVLIAAGQTSAIFTVTAGTTNGTTQLTASTSGGATATTSINVGSQVVEWTSDTAGFWDVPGNWSTGTVPAADDVVIIDRPGSTPTITIRTSTATVRSVHATEPIEITGTLAVAGSAALSGGMTLTGTVTGSGSLLLGGASSWSGGAVLLSGGLEIDTGAVLNLLAPARVLRSGPLTNRGTITWTGGEQYVHSTATLTNAAGGLLNVGGDHLLTGDPFIGGSGTFTNAGTLRKTSGTGALALVIATTNTGTVEIQSGRLEVASAVNAGPLVAASGTAIRLDNFTLEAGTTFGGSGSLTLTGTLTVTAPVSFTLPLTMSAGQLQGSGDVTVRSPMTWSGGIIAGSGHANIASGTSLTLIAGNARVLRGRTVTNHGTVSWTGGEQYVHSSSAIVNAADGLVEIAGDQLLTGDPFIGGAGTFTNDGTLRKTSGTGALQITLASSNTGTMQIETGRLEVSSMANHGTLAPAAGATVRLDNFSLETGTTFGGGGNLVLTGTLNVNAPVSVPLPFAMSAGQLQGAGTVTLTGPMTWSGGILAGAGTLTVANGAALTLTTGGARVLRGRSLINHGRIDWTGGEQYVHSSSSIVNASDGLVEIAGDQLLTGDPFVGGSGTISNAGTIRKVSGPGALSIALAFANAGTIEIQSGRLDVSLASNTGVLNAAAGTTIRLDNFTLEAGTTFAGAGSLMLGGTVTVAGPVAVTLPLTMSAGQLQGGGDVTLSAPTSWSGGVIAGTGQVTVAQGATLTLTSGNARVLRGRTITNNGTISWTGGEQYVHSSSSIVNAAGGTFLIAGDQLLTGDPFIGGSGSMTNAGVVRRTSGTGAFSVTIAFTNTGTVEIQTGRLEMSSAVNTGVLSAASGATIRLDNVTLDSGTTFAGAGSLTLQGTLTVAAPVVIPLPFSMASGQLQGSGDVTIQQSMAWSGGVLTGTGQLVVEPGATLSLLAGSARVLRGRTLTNHGTIDWTGGEQYVHSSSNFVNAADGILEIAGSQLLTGDPFIGGSGTATNAGRLRKVGAIGTLSVGLPLTSTGVIELRLGGTAAGQSDRVAAGSITVGGTLDIRLANGFTPAAGNTFDVLGYGARTGAFSTLLGDGFTYDACYQADRLVLCNVTGGVKATPVITWPAPAPITYGTPLSAAQLKATANVPGTFAYTPSSGSVLPAGTAQLTVTFTPDDETAYNTATASVPLTVHPALLTVTAENKSRVAGTPNPPLTWTISGFTAGDTELVVSGAPILTTTAVESSATGTYPITITQGTLSAVNYAFTFVNGTLTVTGERLEDFEDGNLDDWTLTGDPWTVGGATNTTPNILPVDGLFARSGAPNVAPGDPLAEANVGTATSPRYQVTYSHLSWYATGWSGQSYDGQSAFQILDADGNVRAQVPTPQSDSWGRLAVDLLAAGLAPGDYFHFRAVDANGANNYAWMAFDALELTGTRLRVAPVITWPAPAPITYGTPLGNAQLNATANAEGTFVYTPAAGTILSAGAGHVLSVTFTPADPLQFESATATVTIDVEPALLVVQAEDLVKVAGQPNPPLTYQITGFVNGETATVVTGTPSLTTTATTGSAVGQYPITVTHGTLAAPNYTFTFAAGTLHVVADRTLTLTPATVTLPSGGSQTMTVGVSSTAPTDIVVALISSNTDVASVPASVTIAAGMSNATFTLTGGTTNGTATITASSTVSSTPATASVTVSGRLVEWIRDGDGNWENPANWSIGAVPASGDLVRIDRPAGHFTVTINSTTAAVTLDAAENLVVNGALTITGTAHINGGLTLRAALVGPGSAILGSNMTWEGGPSSIINLAGGLEITSGQTLSIVAGSSGHWLIDSSIRNHGTVDWTAGPLTYRGTSSILNAAGALWEMKGDLILTSDSAGAQTFTNQGTVRRSSGTGTLQLTGIIAHTNVGTLDFQTGSVQFLGGSTLVSSGQISVGADATLFLDRVTLQPGSTFSGGGTLHMNGSTTIAGAITITLSTVLSAAVTGPGPLTMAAPLQWVGGPSSIINLAQGIDIASGQTLSIVAGSSGHWLIDSAIRNHGTVDWTAGPLTYRGTSSILNAAGALWEMKGDLILTSDSAGAQTFTNAGTVRRSSGTGTLQLTGIIAHTNVGTLDFQTGSVQFLSGSALVSSGQISVGADATLFLDRVTLQPGSTFSGGGTLHMNGSTTIAGAITITLPTVLSAAVTGPGPLTMAAPLQWVGGPSSIINLAQGIDIASGQTLSIVAGSSGHWLIDSAIRNHGTVDWTGGPLTYRSASSIVNEASGVWRIAGDAVLTEDSAGAHPFANNGRIERTGPAGTLTIGGNVHLTNNGTIQLRLGGTAAGLFDRITAGAITLGGTLDVRRMNGFTPATGDTFEVLNYSIRTGAFATLLGEGFSYDACYQANALVLCNVTGGVKQTPVITWPPPADITFGTPLGAAQLNATADVPGTFAYTPPAGTLLPVGTSQLSVTFTPADLSQYESVIATVPLTVVPAPLFLCDPNLALASGIIHTFAGSGPTGLLNGGFGGDGGLATNARMNLPRGVAVGDGALFVADSANFRIRRVNLTTCVIDTVAGTQPFSPDFAGDVGDGRPATSALVQPTGLAFGDGALFIADKNNYRIRRVDMSTGIITTVAGTGTPGFGGDDGLATGALLDQPFNIALAGSELYIADTLNDRVRRVDLSTGIITTVAGNGISDSTGDGGAATSASLNQPTDVAVANGVLYIVELARVRRVDLATGVITTVAGTGIPGNTGDGGAAVAARIIANGIALKDNTLYITGLRSVRRVDLTTGIITTAAGTGTEGFSGDGDQATSAMVDGTNDAVVFGRALFLGDTNNHRVRRVQLRETQPMLTVTAPAAAVYGSTFTPVVSGGSGTGTVTLLVNGVCTASGTDVTMTSGTGTCVITAAKAADENFEDTLSAPAAVTAVKASATIALSDLTQAFDGTPKPVTVTTTPGGLSGVTVTYDGAATPPSAVGSYTVVASLANADYQAADATGTLTVTGPLVFDAAASFSLMNGNPNGPWTYGRSTTRGGTVAPLGDTTPSLQGVAGISAWTGPESAFGNGYPFVSKNVTTETLTMSGAIPYLPGQLVLHPSESGAFSVVRFTAPAAGPFTVQAVFQGRDQRGTTTDVHVLVNGVSRFDRLINGFGPATDQSFSTTIVLAAGDVIDFVVGYGSNQSFFEDSTSLAATITASDASPQAPLFVTGAPASAVYGTSFTISTSGGSGGGAVTFAATGACSNDAGGPLITMTSGTGLCTIVATKAAEGTYLEVVSAPVDVTAAKAAQAPLSVIGAPATSAFGASFSVSSAGGSGTGAVTFQATGSCANDVQDDSQVQVTGHAGTCTIVATKAADGNYLEASSAPVHVAIIDSTAPDLQIVAPDRDAILPVSPALVVVDTADGAGVTAVTVNGVPATRVSGSAQSGRWEASVPIDLNAASVSFSVSATDSSSNTASAQLTIDNDGIDTAIDRARNNVATDQSGIYSTEFNNGTTSGAAAASARRIYRITPAAGTAIRVEQIADGNVTARFCGGMDKYVRLDAAGESAEAACLGNTVAVTAGVASPTVQLYKLTNGVRYETRSYCYSYRCGFSTCVSCNFWTVPVHYTYYYRIDLATGQGVSTGSPVVAAPTNTQPLVVALVQVQEEDNTEIEVGTFVLDPGESLEVTNITQGEERQDSLELTVHQGEVEATIDGQQQMLVEGTHPITYDRVPPTAMLASAAPDPTVAIPIPVTLATSEPLVGFTSAALQVTNGTIANFGGSGSLFYFDVIPGGEGLVTVTLPIGSAVDAAGNGNPVAVVLTRTIVAQQAQSIAFDVIPDRPYGSGPLALTALATSGLPVTFTASGACSVSGSTLALSGVGLCTVVASQPGNQQYLPAPPVTRSFRIVYSWSGALDPVNQDGSSVFKSGSTVPVKFRLIDGSAQVTNLQATIHLSKISNGVVGTEIEAVSTAAADSGNVFRYSGGEYIFNLSTKGMSQGSWQIRIELQDGITRTVILSLKK